MNVSYNYDKVTIFDTKHKLGRHYIENLCATKNVYTDNDYLYIKLDNSWHELLTDEETGKLYVSPRPYKKSRAYDLTQEAITSSRYSAHAVEDRSHKERVFKAHGLLNGQKVVLTRTSRNNRYEALTDTGLIYVVGDKVNDFHNKGYIVTYFAPKASGVLGRFSNIDLVKLENVLVQVSNNSKNGLTTV